MLTSTVRPRIVAAGVLGILALGQGPAHAATDAARVVKYAQNDIAPVKAKLRFSTLIILPEKQEILDFTTGDKEFRIINGAHNLCYVHPAQAGSGRFDRSSRGSRLVILSARLARSPTAVLIIFSFFALQQRVVGNSHPARECQPG